MKVVVAKHAGVCYGVERALKLAEEAAASGGVVSTLGPLIHNPQAVAQLKEHGVRVAATLDDASEGILVIRSHGVGPDIIDEAHRRGLDVVDATCPHVSKAHQAAARLAAEGYAVIIVGEADHPEVEGILGYAGEKALVVQSPEELPDVLPGRRIGIVVQTTQSASRLAAIVERILPRVSELRVHNTICSATGQRQRSAEELASTVDVMVVVGGYNSGNTTRLVEICRGSCPDVYHVETSAELDPEWFEGCETVGVTAGASTPDEQIQGVIRAIEAMS